MKKRMFNLLLPFMMTFCFLMPLQMEAQETTIIDEVATTLNENLDSTTFLEYQLKVESLESTVDQLQSKYTELKENGVDSKEDFKNLYSIIMAFLTSFLTFFQRRGWLKNVKQGIVVVIGTAAALVLAMTVFNGDWNVWNFLKEWFVASGGGVLAWELILKYILKKE